MSIDHAMIEMDGFVDHFGPFLAKIYYRHILNLDLLGDSYEIVPHV